MRLPLIISLCWAADTTRDALIVDANHRPRRLDALDAAATSESLAGARAPPPPLEGRISTTPTTEILERLGTLRRFGRKFPTTSVRAGVRSDGKIVSWDGKFV